MAGGALGIGTLGPSERLWKSRTVLRDKADFLRREREEPWEPFTWVGDGQGAAAAGGPGVGLAMPQAVGVAPGAGGEGDRLAGSSAAPPAPDVPSRARGQGPASPPGRTTSYV